MSLFKDRRILMIMLMMLIIDNDDDNDNINADYGNVDVIFEGSDLWS